MRGVRELNIMSGYGFLRGGGQLAELIAAFDWSQTSLGPIADWGAVLKTSVSTALRSPVPIVMLWGRDGIMIYNDAYAGFAGGRHPQLLGSRVVEGWPEVAAFNQHVLDVVLADGTLAFRDQELTLYRHGTAEQVWMNLDYSPIVDEEGVPVAVIAVVVETTAKVVAEAWLSSERERLRQMFEQAPGFMAMLDGPEHVFELANPAYLQLVGHRPVLGKSVRDALPEMAGQGFLEVMDRVFATGEPYIGQALPVRLQQQPDAPFEERFVDFVYQPVRDPAGSVTGIFVQGADVTERVLSERSIRRSMEQFQLFAEAMPNHFWTAPPDGSLDWFNQRVFEYSGLDLEQLKGDGWTSIVHPDDLPQAAARWASGLRTSDPYEVEFRLRRFDGVYRWFIARAVPIPGPDGKVARWLGTNTDIDDQKAIVERLTESEARLRLAIDAGQLAVWDMDLSTHAVTPSVAMNRLYHFADDAVPTAEDYRSRYAPGEAERLAQVGAEAMARGETDLEVEVKHQFPDGSEKWFLIRAQVTTDNRRAIGVVIDITQRRKAEERLLQSERRFRLSQEAAGIASLEVDVATGTVIGSDQFWEIWGLPRQESVHISVLEGIVLPEFAAVRSTPQSRAQGTAQPVVEYRIRRADTGELRWLSRHIEFVNDKDGKPVKMFGVVQDITERKEAQARQNLLTHELEHRIKNILAMVSAIASQTLRNTDLETAAATFTQRLKALATAHDILTRTKWTEASMSDVIAAAATMLPAGRVSISGSELFLQPKMALTLALAVNELATNSLKYGALSNDDGRVEIGWSTADGRLQWQWSERGGPPVTAPSRRGFGRFLIERVLASDFGGRVDLSYDTGGVVCILDAPVPALGELAGVAA